MAARFDDYRHVLRVVALFLLGLVGFFVVRTLMMPAGFGVYGHYRAGALDDVRAQPVKFGGQQSCVDCHSDVAGMRAAGRHARVSCETCHGPLAAHAAEPSDVAPVKPDPRDLCLGCHVRNRSRPAWFPQIVPADHSESGPCSECHQPHKPGIS
jgi:hypothetical protein